MVQDAILFDQKLSLKNQKNGRNATTRRYVDPPKEKKISQLKRHLSSLSYPPWAAQQIPKMTNSAQRRASHIPFGKDQGRQSESR